MKSAYIFLIPLLQVSIVNAFVTVGTDEDCQFSPESLQTAVTSNDEVRLTNQQIFDSINIINNSTTIKGGYNNCLDATNDITSATNSIISGNNISTTLTLHTTSAGGHLPQTVILNNINIINGLRDGTNVGGGIDIVGNMNVTINSSEINNNQSNNFGAGIYLNGLQGAQLSINNSIISNNTTSKDGGGIYISGGAQLNLDAVNLNNNTSKFGGGIAVGSSNNLITISNTTIANNTVINNGGGVYCLHENNLIFNQNNLIRANTAVMGGGVYLSLNCSMLFKSGDTSSLDAVSYGIDANTAEIFGGGVFVGNQARLDLIGSAEHFVNITNNQVNTGSTSQGGGLFATDDGSYIRVINGRISNNSADYGAALYARQFADIHVRRSSGACFANQICSEISNNNTLFTGTISTVTCASVSIYQTKINDNTANSSAVASFEGNNSNSCLSVMEGNLIYGNTKTDANATSMISLDRKSELEFGYNTMTDNNATYDFLLQANSGSTQTLKINSSIIWDAPATPVAASSSGNSFSGNCFAVHDNSSLPAEFGPIIGSNDPIFNDSANNDYSTTNLSPYSDYCDLSLYSPKHHDIVGTVRGHAWLPPVLGPYDMGAYEYDDIHINNVIFQDGIE
jgi:hypothetical protein